MKRHSQKGWRFFMHKKPGAENENCSGKISHNNQLIS